MSYVDAAATADNAVREAQAPDVEAVHLAVELVLFGWTRFAVNAAEPWRWDILATAVQEIVTLFHRRDPIVILVGAGTDAPEPAWLATTRLVATVAGHIERTFSEDLVGVPRHQWCRAVAVLRSGLAAAS